MGHQIIAPGLNTQAHSHKKQVIQLTLASMNAPKSSSFYTNLTYTPWTRTHSALTNLIQTTLASSDHTNLYSFLMSCTSQTTSFACVILAAAFLIFSSLVYFVLFFSLYNTVSLNVLVCSCRLLGTRFRVLETVCLFETVLFLLL